LYYGAEALYVIAQNVAKLSILLFYLRLFPDELFRTITKLNIAFVITHGIAFLIAVIFQCWPITAVWDLTIHGKCMDFQALIYAGAGCSIMEDIVIIVLPIPQLWSLNFNWSKRGALILMFAIGSLYV
jgi:hypothetical protein